METLSTTEQIPNASGPLRKSSVSCLRGKGDVYSVDAKGAPFKNARSEQKPKEGAARKKGGRRSQQLVDLRRIPNSDDNERSGSDSADGSPASLDPPRKKPRWKLDTLKAARAKRISLIGGCRREQLLVIMGQASGASCKILIDSGPEANFMLNKLASKMQCANAPRRAPARSLIILTEMMGQWL